MGKWPVLEDLHCFPSHDSFKKLELLQTLNFKLDLNMHLPKEKILVLIFSILASSFFFSFFFHKGDIYFLVVFHHLSFFSAVGGLDSV